MKASERIIDGLKQGIDRHWRYTKNLLNVKPEYLLTVSVADALTDGFDGICGLDLEIKLEEPTRRLWGSLWINAVGYKNYFPLVKQKEYEKYKMIRKGKVDIYVECNSESWIIELKGFNPSADEIRKEIVRLTQFIAANEQKINAGVVILHFQHYWIEPNGLKVQCLLSVGTHLS